MSARFVVSEVKGAATESVGSGKPLANVTVAVHDRAYCYRDVATFHAEEWGSGYGIRRYGGGGRLGNEHARRLAQEMADRLNAEYGPLDY